MLRGAVLVAIALSSAEAQCDSGRSWCDGSLKSVSGTAHACKDTTSGPCYSELSGWQKETVLEKHNRYRGNHGACPLSYSDRLARYAKDSAGFQTTCTTESLTHNNPPRDPDSGNRLGENLAMVMNGQQLQDWDASQGVANWYCKEEGCYDYGTSTGSGTIGHFTQIVWTNTTEVGCALCHVPSGAYFKKYLICSYSPPGNYRGQNAISVREPPAVAQGCPSSHASATSASLLAAFAFVAVISLVIG
ncbi:Protein PRY1 [Diplonema papillatum]|nr:Protein PRY1 [Diplonema papillatum]